MSMNLPPFNALKARLSITQVCRCTFAEEYKQLCLKLKGGQLSWGQLGIRAAVNKHFLKYICKYCNSCLWCTIVTSTQSTCILRIIKPPSSPYILIAKLNILKKKCSDQHVQSTLCWKWVISATRNDFRVEYVMTVNVMAHNPSFTKIHRRSVRITRTSWSTNCTATTRTFMQQLHTLFHRYLTCMHITPQD